MTSYTPIPSYLKTIPQRYGLIGKRCGGCGAINFPPRETCLECGGSRFEDVKLSGRGKIYTFTIIGRGGAPTEFEDQQKMAGEYAVAIIELEEGPKVVAQLTDRHPSPEEIKIEMEVKAVIRRLYEQEGVIRYGFKFKLS
jgi:uncharacterized OB-fold protein